MYDHLPDHKPKHIFCIIGNHYLLGRMAFAFRFNVCSMFDELQSFTFLLPLGSDADDIKELLALFYAGCGFCHSFIIKMKYAGNDKRKVISLLFYLVTMVMLARISTRFSCS